MGIPTSVAKRDHKPVLPVFNCYCQRLGGDRLRRGGSGCQDKRFFDSARHSHRHFYLRHERAELWRRVNGDRAILTMRYGMIFSMAFSLLVFAVIQIFPAQLLSIFSSDADMIASGTIYIRSFSLECLFVPVLFSLNGLFIGSGHTTFSLFNSCLTSLFVRVPVAYLLGVVLDGGLKGAGLCAPASSLIGMLVSIMFYFSGKWKKSGHRPSKLIWKRLVKGYLTMEKRKRKWGDRYDGRRVRLPSGL